MAKIIEFRLPEAKPLTAEQIAHQVLTPDEAVDAIVSGMVVHVVPTWIAKRWPFHLLEIMADELRAAMSINVPSKVERYQIDAIIEELKPVWKELADQAILNL
jgi:hypothetical protein